MGCGYSRRGGWAPPQEPTPAVPWPEFEFLNFIVTFVMTLVALWMGVTVFSRAKERVGANEPEEPLEPPHSTVDDGEERRGTKVEKQQ